MFRLFALLLALTLAACAPSRPTAAPAAALDPVAVAFVELTLEIGEHEPGYVDAYRGPPEWAEAVKGKPRPTAELRGEAERLIKAAEAIDADALSAIEAKRRAYLIAHLKAAEFRLRMIEGAKPGFVAEAQALFGVTPVFQPLETYKAELARIDAIIPGRGPLAQRVEAFRKRYEIPAAKLETVMRAAIDECRRRTIAHVSLPPQEAFTLEFVTDKPWGGYNWFKGNAKSLIQVNTDNPVLIDRAVDLGCHEGYPGHHVHNLLMESRLYKERGWIEYSIWPLFAPIALIAEGTSNAGIDLAFPGDEKLAFEEKVLYPLAGLDPKTAKALDAYDDAMKRLAGARYAIADLYLGGKIDRAKAVALTQDYLLRNRARAEKDIAFLDAYRSYIVNYGLGEEMVGDYLERVGEDQGARWKAMEALISQPTVPADLLK
jgi:hypothetical protein